MNNDPMRLAQAFARQQQSGLGGMNPQRQPAMQNRGGIMPPAGLAPRPGQGGIMGAPQPVPRQVPPIASSVMGQRRGPF